MSAPSPPPRPANLPPPSAVPPAPFAPKEDYRIGPEDVLDIHVWGHEDLSKQVPVSQTGDFSFPLIGQVKASGRTVAEVQKEMIGRLGDGYLVNPQVTVTVKEYRSQKVFVVGEVKNPGQFKHEQGITVLKAITIAGGLTDKAAARRTTVIREKAGVRVEIPARMSDLVEPNDIVMVPESFF